MEEAALGPALMVEEFEPALLDSKSGQAEGMNKMPAELLKAFGTQGKENCMKFVIKHTYKENGHRIF